MATGLIGEKAETMAKRRNDVVVKIDAEVMEEVRLAATFEGLSIAEYLSERMRVVAAQDIAKGIERREQATKPKPKK